MEMNIEISDYLSEEEIKEIVRQEFADRLRNHFDSEYNIERIISNTAYKCLGEELDKLVPNYKEILNKNIKEVFNSKDSISYELFSMKSTPANIMLENIIKDNKQLIEEKIKETILSYDFSKAIYDKASNLIGQNSDNMYEFIELLKNKQNGK